MSSKTLHMPCTVQQANDDQGIRGVIATENALGLDLHALEPEPEPDPDPDHNEPPHEIYWGRLSLDGWGTLAEMYLLRHHERARKLVEKWQVLKDAKQGDAKP